MGISPSSWWGAQEDEEKPDNTNQLEEESWLDFLKKLGQKLLQRSPPKTQEPPTEFTPYEEVGGAGDSEQEGGAPPPRPINEGEENEGKDLTQLEQEAEGAGAGWQEFAEEDQKEEDLGEEKHEEGEEHAEEGEQQEEHPQQEEEVEKKAEEGEEKKQEGEGEVQGGQEVVVTIQGGEEEGAQQAQAQAENNETQHGEDQIKQEAGQMVAEITGPLDILEQKKEEEPAKKKKSRGSRLLSSLTGRKAVAKDSKEQPIEAVVEGEKEKDLEAQLGQGAGNEGKGEENQQRFEPKPPTEPKEAQGEKGEAGAGSGEKGEDGKQSDGAQGTAAEEKKRPGGSGIGCCVCFPQSKRTAPQEEESPVEVTMDPVKSKLQEEVGTGSGTAQVNYMQEAQIQGGGPSMFPGAIGTSMISKFPDALDDPKSPDEKSSAKVDGKADPATRLELKRHLFYFINTVHLFGIVSLNPYVFDGDLVGFARVMLMDASAMFDTTGYKEGLAWSFVLFFWLYYGYLTLLGYLKHAAENIYNVHHVWNLVLGAGLIGLSAFLFWSTGWCKKGDSDCVDARIYYGCLLLIFPIFVLLVWNYFFCFRGYRLYGCLGCERCCGKSAKSDDDEGSPLYNPLAETDYEHVKRRLHQWTIATYQVMTYMLFVATAVAFAEVFDTGALSNQVGACFGIGIYIGLIALLTLEPSFSVQYQGEVHFYKPLFATREFCMLEVWFFVYILVFLLEKIILVWIVVTMGGNDELGRDAGIGCAVVIVLWAIITLFVPYNVDDENSKAFWAIFCGEGQQVQLNGRFLDVAGRVVTLAYLGFALASAQSDTALQPLFKTLSFLFYVGLFAFWFRYLYAVDLKGFLRKDLESTFEVTTVDSSKKSDESGGSGVEEASGEETKEVKASEDGEEDEQEQQEEQAQEGANEEGEEEKSEETAAETETQKQEGEGEGEDHEGNAEEAQNANAKLG